MYKMKVGSLWTDVAAIDIIGSFVLQKLMKATCLPTDIHIFNQR